MTFADSKTEAIQKRMNLRAMGLCSCYTRLKYDPTKFYVSHCPINFCKKDRDKSPKGSGSDKYGKKREIK